MCIELVTLVKSPLALSVFRNVVEKNVSNGCGLSKFLKQPTLRYTQLCWALRASGCLVLCMYGSNAPVPNFPVVPVGGNVIININHHGPMNPIFVTSPAPVQVSVPTDGTAIIGGNPLLNSHHGVSQSSGPFRWEWMNNCQHCWNSFMNTMRTQAMKAPSLYAYIKENRWSLAAKTTVGLYVFINLLLFRMVNFLSAPQRWMYWRSDLLLVQLMRMSSADVIQELLASLSMRTNLPPDQKPIELLFAELDDEICRLQDYNRWVNFITKLSTIQNYCALSAEALLPTLFGVPLGYMGRIAINAFSLKNIFYIDYELIQRTPEYLRRLIYLRRILEEELAVDLPQVITENVQA